LESSGSSSTPSSLTLTSSRDSGHASDSNSASRDSEEDSKQTKKDGKVQKLSSKLTKLRIFKKLKIWKKKWKIRKKN